MNKELVSIVTLTNSSYKEYTLNCIESLRRCDFNGKLKCYCLDEECYNFFSKESVQLSGEIISAHLVEDTNWSELVVFGAPDWHDMMFRKYPIIHENLLTNDYVLYIDGDIVFENKIFLDYMLSNIGDNDLFVQQEWPQSKKNTGDDFGSRNEICAGVMFIKANPTTIDFFNPENARSSLTGDESVNDQDYLNKVAYRGALKYKLLPIKLFSNGKYYYDEVMDKADDEIAEPYLIHFNWIIGKLKIAKMKQAEKWYIND